MKFLIIGSGGREHALAWRLQADGSAEEVYVAPGNGGIDPVYRVSIEMTDFEKIESFCREKAIDMVVVGPEAPLAAGIVDYLEDKEIPVFGPRKQAAQLESSKIYAKEIMGKCNVNTAGFNEFVGKKELLQYIESVDQFPQVIKLDGLAAGKGVGIPENLNEAKVFIEENVRDDTPVFVEDYIDGEEASVLGLCDGNTVLPFIAAQDHKRIFDGDKGPNTGGMGAYAPAPVLDEAGLERVRKEVLQPVVDGMKKEGVPFKGILYAGLMIQGDEIKVLEFNVRFGDPETQALLPLLDGKLGDLFAHAVNGTLDTTEMKFKNEHAITVVVSSGGYPGAYEKGIEISGLDSLNENVILYHAGTTEKDGVITTNGGRVLTVTSTGSSLQEARDNVYKEIDKISFDGAFYRKDIAYRALDR